LGLLPMGLHLPEKIASIPPAQLVSVVYLGLVPTVIGFLCWSFALSRAPASRISSLLSLQPVGACVIAWFWLGEIPAWLTLVGGVLAIGGVILTTTRKRLLPAPLPAAVRVADCNEAP